MTAGPAGETTNLEKYLAFYQTTTRPGYAVLVTGPCVDAIMPRTAPRVGKASPEHGASCALERTAYGGLRAPSGDAAPEWRSAADSWFARSAR